MRVVAKVLGVFLLAAALAFAAHGVYTFFLRMGEGSGPPVGSFAAGAPLAMLGMLLLRYGRQSRRR